jgi:hypothetical protein
VDDAAPTARLVGLFVGLFCRRAADVTSDMQTRRCCPYRCNTA